MKALVKAKSEVGIWLQEEPMPVMGINDILVKVKKTAICGTDIHIYNWDEWAQKTIPVPMIVGHEFVGTIADIGSEVTGLKVGQRISGEGHITCNHCRNCRAGKRHLCRNTFGVGVNRPGCFAEYLVIPASNACPLPDDITDDEAAILDPLGNAVHTALSFDLVGEDVLITGAGPIGIMAVSIAKKAGARYVAVSDINDYRLNLARLMGADDVINVKHDTIKNAMDRLKMIEGFDIGLEMSGNATAITDMITHLNHGAKMALLGIPPSNVAIDWTQVVFKGLHIKGIYGREMYETWYKMISMLQSGLNISPIITDHFKIDDYQQAFNKMLSGNTGKVILNWE